MDHALSSAGNLLAETLKRLNLRLVFAESCTAGLASATLAETPGVSTYHCGSAVTYQNATKHDWLGVPWELLEPPGPGAVSEPVARAMALGVLQRTSHADVAAAITGHLGPIDDPSLDGLVWYAVARRMSHDELSIVAVRTERLPSEGLVSSSRPTLRMARQAYAATRLLTMTREFLEERE
jgi:PncC family amidohydrolase